MLYDSLYIAETTKKGRGVFTEQAIEADIVIETAPVIVMDDKAKALLDQTLLHDYIFDWQPDGNPYCCVALGWASIYNHASPSNCEYEMDYDAQTISIKTVRNIVAGEELTINYNGDWDNASPVWFDAHL